jgi:hypothetical protein
MTDEEIAPLFDHLYRRSIVNLARIEKRPPLLAHYTSLEVLEKIMKNNEIWFSNPLFYPNALGVTANPTHGMAAVLKFAQAIPPRSFPVARPIPTPAISIPRLSILLHGTTRSCRRRCSARAESCRVARAPENQSSQHYKSVRQRANVC